MSIQVNGKGLETDQKAIMYNDEPYIPSSVVGDALGYDVSWDEDANQVDINGRIELLDYNGAVIPPGYTSRREARVEGLISNSSDRPATHVGIKCTVTDSTGADQVIYASLDRPVPAQDVIQFRISKGYDNDAVERQSVAPTTCELMDVVYGEEE